MKGEVSLSLTKDGHLAFASFQSLNKQQNGFLTAVLWIARNCLKFGIDRNVCEWIIL